MAKSRYLSKKLLNHSLAVEAYAMPAAVYLALFTSVEGLESGSLAHEVAGAGYARRAFIMPAAVDDGTGGKVVSTAAVDFAPSTGDWGEMQAWAVMDAAEGGNVLHYGSLPKYGDPGEFKKIWAGDGFRVRSGDMSLSER
jgi:hypothetical protein